MSSIKPIKVWGKGGPNPPKVALITEELEIPYDLVEISFPDLKKPEYLAINPNGRMPAIHDPNTDIILWESGAIVEYLIEKYDTEYKLSFKPGTAEYFHAKQWLYFQCTGQGPYYGQAMWFKKFHGEQIPSAIERYVKEINRVTGVLESHLAKQKEDANGVPWLVGGKMSYADLSFVLWQQIPNGGALSEEEFKWSDYPVTKKWFDAMMSREKVKMVVARLWGGH